MKPERIAENLARVRQRITDAARNAGRDPGAVTLIAVSKTRPAVDVVAALSAGQTHFGENYVQEAVDKIREVKRLAPHASPVWHYIGAIQTNKTRDLAANFHWVHTISREKVARRLNTQRPDGERLNVCLQVNVDGDPNKAGIPPEEAAGLLTACAGFERLALRGLMTILDPRTDPVAGYHHLRACFEDLAQKAPAGWDTLSMGMSADYPAAIAAGATLVRVGSAIFGPRATQKNSRTGSIS